MSVPQRLKSFLDSKYIPYQSLAHSTTYTAQGTATLMHISGKEIAKTVVLCAGAEGEDTILAVLPGSKHVKLDKLAAVIGKPVRLASEPEFSSLFPDCELGAMPPFGSCFGMPVIVDTRLAARFIAFNPGTHRDVVRMSFADSRRIAMPLIATITAVAAAGRDVLV